MKRASGSGGLYEIPSRNLWRAVIDLGRDADGVRRQWTATSKSRDVAERKLHAKLTALGRPVIDPAAYRPARLRVERMRSAGRRASQAERRAVLRNAPDRCRYCQVRLDVYNSQIDHIEPVARGGADAASNMQVICWECNVDKCDTDPELYRAWAEASRLRRSYSPMPSRRGWHEGDRSLRGGL